MSQCLAGDMFTDSYFLVVNILNADAATRQLIKDLVAPWIAMYAIACVGSVIAMYVSHCAPQHSPPPPCF